MRDRLTSAGNRLGFVPPHFNPVVLAFSRLIAPAYLRFTLGLRFNEITGIEKLAEEYKRFSRNESRLLLVFRHVNVHDAQVIFSLLNNVLPRQARQRGRPLSRRSHAHFLYGRGVPLWAGAGLGWLFSRLGAIPVSHRKLNRESINIIRRFIVRGDFPLALAPEGQVTYHNRHVYEIEPGLAQLALWACEDQEKEVRILPISQYYHYGNNSEAVLWSVLDRIEAETGVEGTAAAAAKKAAAATSAGLEASRERLQRIGARLLTLIETFYRQFYQISLDEDWSLPSDKGDRGGAEPITEQEFSRRRVERLTDAVLALQERKFGIRTPYSGFTPRIFTVRQAGWDRMFHLDPAERHKHGSTPNHGRSKLQKGMEDYIAAETDLFTRHLELVDMLSYLRPEYGTEAREAEEPNMLVETALNLHDILMRMRGGNISDRLNIRPTYVSITAGEPISLAEPGFFSEQLTPRGKRRRIISAVEEQFEHLATEFRFQ